MLGFWMLFMSRLVSSIPLFSAFPIIFITSLELHQPVFILPYLVQNEKQHKKKVSNS